MKVIAEQKFLRMSPIKIRQVARAIRGIKEPQQATTVLSLLGKRAARPLAKVIQTAMANAKNNFNLAPQDLRIREIQVGDGPRYKRYQPAARGLAHPILKRTSHIRVVLEAQEKPKAEKPEKVSKVNSDKKGGAGGGKAPSK